MTEKSYTASYLFRSLEDSEHLQLLFRNMVQGLV